MGLAHLARNPRPTIVFYGPVANVASKAVWITLITEPVLDMIVSTKSAITAPLSGSRDS